MSLISSRVGSVISAVLPPAMSPEKETAFDRHCRERTSRIAVIFAVLCLTCALLWWPVDYVVYRDLPRFIGPTRILRIAISALAVAYLLLTRFAAIRARDGFLFVFMILLVCVLLGVATGLMGDLDKPQFHILYILVFITVPLPIRLSSRVVFTVACVGALFAGYLLPFAAYRSSPYLALAVSFFVCMIGVSVIFGHVSFLLLRSNFFQAALLAENVLLLEERVKDRTRELRELLSQLESTREEERNRIAREIHDELGQELTAQRLTLAIAEDCLDSEPATARTKLAEMRLDLDRMMNTIRSLIADLRPWILHDLGLGEAVQWLARRTEEIAGLECTLSVSGDPGGVDSVRSAAVFRILQESLNNVTKHAQAKSVAIEITTTLEALVLRVQDDGIGPSERPKKRSFGLLGMRERAHALGGEFSLRGVPDGGTEVTCRLPLGVAIESIQ